MIWVYAVVDRPDLPPPRCPGLGDGALAIVAAGPIAAVVGTVAGRPTEMQVDALWRHEEVIEALMRDRTALPVRYGTVAATASDVSAALARASAALVAGLAHVAGRVEIAVRFIPDRSASIACVAATAPSGREGTAFLMARVAVERAARQRNDRLMAAVGPALARLGELAVAHHAEVVEGPVDSVASAFLVERDGLAAFRNAVAAIAAADPRRAVLCSGPWPAYSFVGGAMADLAAGASSDARH